MRWVLALLGLALSVSLFVFRRTWATFFRTYGPDRAPDWVSSSLPIVLGAMLLVWTAVVAATGLGVY